MNSAEGQNKRNRVTPEKVLEMMKQNGQEVTIAEATLILEFLRTMAGMAVTQYLEKWKRDRE